MSAFALYVHWPFCAAKCPYCDFNSHVREAIAEEDWVASILSEMRYAAEMQGEARPVLSTVFFGGGTPSLMQGKSVGRILEEARALWPWANDVEITLEANPASADAARFADYKAAGVNRVSLGIQALNDADLKFLGRLHDLAEAKAALVLAQKNFDRVSLDLIYARPGQTLTAWESELKEALAIGTEHLSLYQLTIEPQTPFSLLHQRGKLVIPDEDHAAALFDLTQEITAAAGLPAYEVSNHARPGCDARHNLVYWRYGSYAGVGPGAHGRLWLGDEIVATVTERLPERWLKNVAANRHGYTQWEKVACEDAAHEHLLMNLRLAEGLDLAAYRERWGITLSPPRIAELEAQGLVTLQDGHLKASKRGLLVLNSLIAELAD
ncbi:oxygen-independent coproporphyrinogen-3 oxidase [Rhizomicrobium palustre]|uniref:Heme chaperone HemW n=1 Tax=Rhizomicrobium palustre TaxID=189966 RepID=A0A846MYW1_9PROT|nr:radical SAM family heme chaperone HemW [Rhizomicrobium palustre]NIK88160.1 oxygen-independent coproporphyrinogen-3 oxidase [Rhizomicrobium palustre]